MPSHPTAYLVLASQRSGSTLLVETLRALTWLTVAD